MLSEDQVAIFDIYSFKNPMMQFLVKQKHDKFKT